MCGILGVAVNPDDARSSLLQDVPELLGRLMIANHYRGGDSYGLAIVPRNNERITTLKQVGSFVEHMQRPKKMRPWRRTICRIQGLIDDKIPFVVIGHNRKATHGDITQRNAMPFLYGDKSKDSWIVGSHNGVITNYKRVIDEFHLNKLDIQVDSEVIFRSLQKNPYKDALPSLTASGSMAIAYMQNSIDKLYMFRNTNPISFVKKPGIMVWNSESFALHTAAGTNLSNTIFTPIKDNLTVFDLDALEVEEVQKIEEKRYFYTGPRGCEPARVSNSPYRNNAVATRYSYPSSTGAVGNTKDIEPTKKGKCDGCSQLTPFAQMIYHEKCGYCAWCYVGHVQDDGDPIKYLKNVEA